MKDLFILIGEFVAFATFMMLIYVYFVAFAS